MKRTTLFQIAREGWFAVIPLVALVLVAHALQGWWATLACVLLLALAVPFFHDRPRHVAARPLAIIAPTNGVVLQAHACHDPFLDRPAQKISMRVAWFGGYYLRSPVEGTLLELEGVAVTAISGMPSWIRTDEGDDIVIAVSAGNMLGASPCHGNYGQRVGQGRCCGVKRYARMIDVYLPADTRLMV